MGDDTIRRWALMTDGQMLTGLHGAESNWVLASDHDAAIERLEAGVADSRASIKKLLGYTQELEREAERNAMKMGELVADRHDKGEQ